MDGAVLTPTGYKVRTMQTWDEVAPRYHKRWAGPGLGPFACTETLIHMVQAQRGHVVLDVACGTGTVLEQLTAVVGPEGMVVGVDVSAGALAIARRRLSSVHLVQADAENVRFVGQFDAITCQFGLFFFFDASLALQNLHHMLKPNGKLGVVVHGDRDSVPYHGCIIREALRFMPDYIPAGTPALDRYSDEESLDVVVRDTGFSNISVQKKTYWYSPGDFAAYWRDYTRYVAEPYRKKIQSLGITERHRFQKAVQEAVRPYTDPYGTINFPWQVLFLSASP